jgi:hypothetical protein
MISSENKRKELEHILNRHNFVKIAEAIKMLRNESPFTGAIGLLVSYYDSSEVSSIKKLINEFLNDLKDQALCQEVIAEIKKDHKTETRRMLISSCWQSGLNYSGFSVDFAGIFNSADYMTAIECFSVIESSVHNLSRKEKDGIIKIIRKGSDISYPDRRELALQLISILV